jgi:hypothetical protein
MQVEQQDMGLNVRDHLHGYREISCFADDLDSGFVFQEALDGFPHDGAVVGQ